jgi:RNA polymerase sigma factor (TIGR02999 family)
MVDRAEEPDGSASQPLTLLLNRMGQGDRAAADEAARLVYAELHRIASRELRPERRGHLLQTTALVNEAYLRLAESGPLEFRDRGHFFALASRQMRRVLVDYARKEKAARRGGGAFAVELDSIQIPVQGRGVEVLLLDEGLRSLEGLDARAVQGVELRYFGGYSEEETAEALGVALITVRRDWAFAKAWLFNYMNGHG